ncbi:homeobox-leucine zipper protein ANTHOCYANINLESS 2 isoform X2 [Morus notabilis]|uniref:homeobox-leucine zipper protein ANTHOCYANINLESS 2 isoform X2 n=1 Tax=Morus notabilis TaxID=981085 RepID=UPI000CED5888|nr:homeobox-leucine zipper protein ANTHOCYANINLESS 2 isoform X2 [Morus notabilis]
MITSPVFSFSTRNMDSHGEMGLLGENFDLGIIGRMRDDGYESRSGSDNLEGASGDDQDAGDDQPRKKKKYHRHTPNQIQELEAFFKECPHPDEKQRLELSKRLGLETKQVKFWFQNRRTQMKTQLERHENIILRQENDKLQAENNMMKDAMATPMCNQCGGPAIPGQISFEEHQLRIENARLKDELNRICALANKFLGRPLSSLATPIPLPSSTSSLELAVGRNGMGGLNVVGAPLPMGLELGDGISSAGPMIPMMKHTMGMNVMGTEIPFERSMLIDLALAAMDEFIKMAQANGPLWIKSTNGGKETLNYEEYMRTFPSCIGPKPSNYVSEATRDSSVVIINSLALVETLMDANRWTEMFPCLVARASTIEMISTGIGGTRNGALQVINAELQVLSPLVPLRPLKFLRFCKQHADGVWAVVDVSVDINRDATNANSYFHCRRLPSGCLVQDMPDGYSKVTWIEHSEYDDSGVHQMFRSYLICGMGFGAQRWLATLQRQCECLAILTSPSISNENQLAMSPSGKRSMLKLAQRMVDNFCAGVTASTVRKWDKLCVGTVGEDVRVMTRKSMDDPGEPPGIILSAATSVWIPVSQKRLFEFLRDERFRSDWDILSNGGPMQEMVHITKCQRHGNHVSLLRASTIGTNDSSMLILQETWNDASGSMVVYAPVDRASINVVMHGGDSAYVALLPSGFAILPDGSSQPNYCSGPSVKGEASNGEGGGGGCLLSVGFQILVNSLPTAKLTVESVETVNNLISCTIQKIKAALNV